MAVSVGRGAPGGELLPDVDDADEGTDDPDEAGWPPYGVEVGEDFSGVGSPDEIPGRRVQAVGDDLTDDGDGRTGCVRVGATFVSREAEIVEDDGSSLTGAGSGPGSGLIQLGPEGTLGRAWAAGAETTLDGRAKGVSGGSSFTKFAPGSTLTRLKPVSGGSSLTGFAPGSTLTRLKPV